MAVKTYQIWKLAFYIVALTSRGGVNIAVADITCQVNNVWASLGEGAEDVEYLPNATSCDIPNCHDGCFCSLGFNGTFVATCSGGSTTTDVIFPQRVETLYLGFSWLSEISPFAFNKVGNSCKQLYLNNNELTDIHPGAFNSLTTSNSCRCPVTS